MSGRCDENRGSQWGLLHDCVICAEMSHMKEGLTSGGLAVKRQLRGGGGSAAEKKWYVSNKAFPHQYDKVIKPFKSGVHDALAT